MNDDYIESHDVIERYLANRLTEAELEQFEERLLWSEETRRDVESMARLASGMTSVAEERRRIRWLSPVMSAAASAALAVGITLLVVQTPRAPGVITTTNVLHVEATRSIDARPEIEASVSDSWLTLMLYPDFSGFSRLRLTIERSNTPDDIPLDPAGWQTVWQGNADPGSRDSVVVSMRSDLLTLGVYRVRTEGLRDGAFKPIGVAEFRIVAPRR